MEQLSIVVAFIALLVSAYAVVKVRSTFTASAYDRALIRFSAINKLMFEHPDFSKVFSDPYDQIKGIEGAPAFAWYVLNQFEVMYLDRRLNLLTEEYFQSYRHWFADRLNRNSALRDIIKFDCDRNKKYFHPAFWEFANGLMKPAQPPTNLAPTN